MYGMYFIQDVYVQDVLYRRRRKGKKPNCQNCQKSSCQKSRLIETCVMPFPSRKIVSVAFGQGYMCSEPR